MVHGVLKRAIHGFCHERADICPRRSHHITGAHSPGPHPEPTQSPAAPASDRGLHCRAGMFGGKRMKPIREAPVHHNMHAQYPKRAREMHGLADKCKDEDRSFPK